MSAYTKDIRVLPLLLLFAFTVKKILAGCVVGEFQKSEINGPCPDGMAVVTRRDVCQAITIVDGESVKFDSRVISCLNLHTTPFGCYFYGKLPFARIQFNTKDSKRCETTETADIKLLRASICECTPTTTMTAADTSDISPSTSNGTAMPKNNITQNDVDVIYENTTQTTAASTSSILTSDVELTVSGSSRCPEGTVVLSDEQQCQRAQHSIGSFSGDKAVKYVGRIGDKIVSERPPGCFVDLVSETQECIESVCIQFNAKAEISKHDKFPESTNFLAICVPSSEADANDGPTQTAKVGTTTTTTPSTTTTTTSTLTGCEGQGKIYKSPFCPENTYSILSEESCRKSAQRLNLNEMQVSQNDARLTSPSGCYILSFSKQPLFNPLRHTNTNISNLELFESICCEKPTTTISTTTISPPSTPKATPRGNAPSVSANQKLSPKPTASTDAIIENINVETTNIVPTTKKSFPATAPAVPSNAATKSPAAADSIPAIVAVVIILLVIVVIVLAIVCYKMCQKTKESSDAKEQIAEQENTIATLSSAVAAPMMDPNLSTTQAMKIWMANGLMLSSANITRGKKIGYGGAGQVYHGVWGSVDVALKESYSLTMSGKAKEVINEVSTLTKLNNPKIVRLFGMWYDNSVPNNPKLYMVMEYCAKGSLSDHIVRSFDEVSKEQRRNWSIQISEAMAFLHTRDPCIVHRDLKPANVLLDQNNACKVADFGLSRDVTDSNRDFTQNIGTVAYMPPEALETSQSCGDEPKHCSEASELLGTKWDVYSYAIMYLYILTGQRPYRGLDNRQIMLYVFVKRERPTIDDDTLTREERQLVQDMWKTDLRKRPSFQNILQRQYAMYRRDAEVKILQTPAKKINMTKEHLLGNAQPFLELTPIKKNSTATPPMKPVVRNSAPVIGLPPISFPAQSKKGSRQKKSQRSQLPKTNSLGQLRPSQQTSTASHGKLQRRRSSSADQAHDAVVFASAMTPPKLPPKPPPKPLRKMSRRPKSALSRKLKSGLPSHALVVELKSEISKASLRKATASRPPSRKAPSNTSIPKQDEVIGSNVGKKLPKKPTSQLSLLEN